MSRHLGTSATMQMAIGRAEQRRTSRAFGKEFVRTSSCRWDTGKTIREVLLPYGWERVPTWVCMIVHRQRGLFSSVYVDDIMMAGKKYNLESMWKKLMNKVDLETPTPFLDQVYLGCTQRECKPNQNLVDENRNIVESRISAGPTEKLPDS